MASSRRPVELFPAPLQRLAVTPVTVSRSVQRKFGLAERKFEGVKKCEKRRCEYTLMQSQTTLHRPTRTSVSYRDQVVTSIQSYGQIKIRIEYSDTPKQMERYMCPHHSSQWVQTGQLKNSNSQKKQQNREEVQLSKTDYSRSFMNDDHFSSIPGSLGTTDGFPSCGLSCELSGARGG